MSSISIETIDSSDSTREIESHLTSEWSIGHDGRYYIYDGHRYQRLADAVAYAQLLREQGSQQTHALGFAQSTAMESPTASDRQLMLELSISFEDHAFLFEGHRYDRLKDAMAYARHRRQLREKAL